MGFIIAVMAVLSAGYAVMKHRHRRKQAAARKRRAHREKERESRKEAHYMRNFWNYDGSCQEEFEE